MKSTATNISEELEGFLQAVGGDRLRLQETGGGDADAAADRDDSAAERQDDTERHRHVHPAGSQSGMVDLSLQLRNKKSLLRTII